MTSIQVLLAVFVIPAVCGAGYSGDYQPQCYKVGGYCEIKNCRKGFKAATKYSYGCPSDSICCLVDISYNNYEGHFDNRGRGYCTNNGCQSGYNYYDNNGYCKYGNRSYKYNCHYYAGCCLPRNPYSKLHYYCTNNYGCPKNYYFYNNHGYYYYNSKDYYDCHSYNGCCIRGYERSYHY
ncbi:uncharacterized protein LOC127703780 isoform X3 [Mytilus californianus]|uniref:uncharacterized protein LOC127703780 isoform X3 n=1 Tax=Mytilus californianus TaxID=6549 RepID=UPI002245BDE7|nr:uncharacterized protein LOC127703780 isoform X3 [Mytilus californianus]